MLKGLCKNVIYWYHFKLNHPGGSRRAKKNREVCYWKGLVTQAELFAKTCKICQQFKNRKTLYGYLPPKNIEELKTWNTVNVDLMVPYIKSIRQQKPGGTVIQNNACPTCMTMIEPALEWFDIVEIPAFYLEEVALGNYEYIDKSSSRVTQMFNNAWICRYPRPRKVVFDTISQFKQYFTLLLKDFNINPVLTLFKNPQANAPAERLHQVIINMLVTKDLDNKLIDYIDPWGETLASIAWEVIDSYHRTIMATPSQDVFGRDI